MPVRFEIIRHRRQTKIIAGYYADDLMQVAECQLIHQQGDFPVKISQARLGHVRSDVSSDVSMEIYEIHVKMPQSERPDVTFTRLAEKI